MNYREFIIWLSVLSVLYFMEEGGPSLCLFRFAGFGSCPGCGIGHAIHYALHWQFRQSFGVHIMGVPATVLLVLFALRPFFQTLKNHRHKYEPATAHDAAGSAAR